MSRLNALILKWKMMSEQTNLEKLGQKVSKMLRDFDDMRMENMQLKENIERLELDATSKMATMAQMQEELSEKDREIEKIVHQIESILG